MATRHFSTSTGISIPPTYAWPPVGCVPLDAKRTLPAPIPWRWRKPGRQRPRDIRKQSLNFISLAGCIPTCRSNIFSTFSLRTPGLIRRLTSVANWKNLGAACTLQMEPESVYRGLEAGQTFDSIRQTLEKLKLAGVDSLPGGGAEIFADRVRSIICDHKIDGAEWLETARTAHQLGLRSNATMLYGHIENDEDRVDHLLKLRSLQDETGGFQTFIPLAFHPDNTPLRHLPKTTGMLDIKNIAIGRLVLDNFSHIKAYWQMLTPKIAQIALRFGADDLYGTVIEEKIYHDAGASTPQGLRRSELERLIREAGREPVERDTMYHPVIRSETSFTIAV